MKSTSEIRTSEEDWLGAEDTLGGVASSADDAG